MTLDEIVVDIRREFDQPEAVGRIGNNEVAAFVNRGHELLSQKIVEADQNFFEESDQTLGFVADQEEYDIPAAVQDRKITRITRTDQSSPHPLRRIRFQEKDQYANTDVFNASSGIDGAVYYIRGTKLGLKPTPKTTIATNIKIYYIAQPHELHWAEADSPTATTFRMPTATSGASPIMKAGRVSTTPNYYIGAKIRVLTGTDRGLERTITAFNVATRFATIGTSWTQANISNQQYVILSPIPVEYHDLLCQYAIMKLSQKIGDTQRFQVAKEFWTNGMDSLINTIEPRSYDENQYVRPPVDGWD